MSARETWLARSDKDAEFIAKWWRDRAKWNQKSRRDAARAFEERERKAREDRIYRRMLRDIFATDPEACDPLRSDDRRTRGITSSFASTPSTI